MKFDFVVFDASSSNRERLREAWTSVMRQIDDPAYYHYFEWYESYVKILEPEPVSVFFVVAYWNHEPVGVFPLRFARARIAGIPLRALEIPHSPVTLLGDF